MKINGTYTYAKKNYGTTSCPDFIRARQQSNEFAVFRGDNWVDILLETYCDGEKFAPMVVVDKFQSERVMGSQNYGNRVTLYYFNGGGKMMKAEKFVPCLTRYEPETRNHIGRLGAYLDIENEDGIRKQVETFAAQFETV